MKIKIMNRMDLTQNSEAWINSRPQADKRTTYRDIVELDLPTNEFANVNLFIESSIVEREIISTMRNHVMWAQTSRVEKILGFEMDHTTHTESQTFAINQKSKMKRMAADGVRQDEFRLGLPLLARTKYSISVSFRTLVKLHKYFLWLSIQGGPLSQRFRVFAKHLFDVLVELRITHNDIEKYKTPVILSVDRLAGSYKAASSNSSGIITVTDKLPIHLRAQLVRHRGIGIRDNFFDLITSNRVLESSLETVLNVTTYGTESDFAEVLSKRTCWVAHYKIWKGYLAMIERQSKDDGNKNLPCEMGSCPFAADVMLRYEGKDPNPTCPRFALLNDLPVNETEKLKMSAMVTSDNRPAQFWSPIIEKLRS